MLALSTTTISSGWSAALTAAVDAPKGRALHLVVAIERPGVPEEELVSSVDDLLAPGHHSVSTVASTVFPSNMYADPGLSWHPDLPLADEQRLDVAAEDLYEMYRMSLPLLCTAAGNQHGTYFGRLVSWPGKTDDGYNQLAVRVRQLRAQRRQHKSTSNAADLVVEGDAERATDVDISDDGEGNGLQIYRSTDERTRAFPCLVHVDLSVLNNQLSLLAVYRHWHMITKALGNLIGLSRLQHFLAQQTGYEVGEMVVHGTVANAQFDDFGARRVRELAKTAQALLLDKSR